MLRLFAVLPLMNKFQWTSLCTLISLCIHGMSPEGIYCKQNSYGILSHLFFERTEQSRCCLKFPSFLQKDFFSLMEYMLHEGGDLCLFCSLLYSKHLEECQAHERHSINMWWTYEWFLNVRFCSLNYANSFHRAPNRARRISIYSSWCIENCTQTSHLHPKGDWERGFFLEPSTSSGCYCNSPRGLETGR